MIVRFTGNPNRHPLDKRVKYDIDFRNENNIVIADFYKLPGKSHEGTFIFSSMQEFLNSVSFENVKYSRRVRKTTDFDKTLFFSTGEVAEYLGVSNRTIERYVQKGWIEPSRFTPAGHKRFARENVVKLAEQLMEGAG